MTDKMKVFELKNIINEKAAGKFTIESKDIQKFLETSKGIKKSHSSNLVREEIDYVESHFLKQTQPPSQAKQQPTQRNEQEKVRSTEVKINERQLRPENQSMNNHRTDNQRVYTQRQDGNRPDSNDNRNQRSYGQRQDGNRSGSNDNRSQRSYGQRQDGNRSDSNDNRSQRPYGQRQDGNRSDYNDNRNQRSYGQRQDGNRPGSNDNRNQRPYGQRQDGQRQDGNRPGYSDNRSQRPYGQRQDGNRPGSNDNRNQRPYGQRQDGNRPSFNNRGMKQEGEQNQYGGQRQSAGQRTDSGRQGGRGFGGNNERKNFDQQILDQKVAEKNENRKSRERNSKDKEKYSKDKTNRNLKNKKIVNFGDEIIQDKAPKKGQFIKPAPVVAAPEEEIKTIVLPEVLTIKELADKMKMPGSVLVKKLFLQGKMVAINNEISFDEAEEIALEYDIIAEKEEKIDVVAELLKEEEEVEETLKKRPPVVCVMGHVDHGKTSLLDAIRETHVTSREAGGITQHIGAYIIQINDEAITFLDTPGHEAFTSMRMRGAKSTDIAILVVAADDGVMPQTIEAINHARAAGVEIIVAINKIDKPSANIDRVKQELTEHGLIAEDWGGDTVFVPVSAHTKEGIDTLLEMINLTAEMLELKANPDRRARGIVIEAELDKGKGPVATILVQKGTLKVGDNVVIGSAYGKVRAMMDDKGDRVEEATPSTPVEILGLNEVPNSGEIFIATESEKEARNISEAFITQGREKLLADTKAKLSLDGLFNQIQAGNIKDFNLIIKADVQGSVEAMKQSLIKLSNEEVAVRVIHGGVGAINESDVILASASNAVIIGFNVRPDNAAKETVDREKVEVKLYRVIYHAIEDIEAAIKGMLDPIFEEKVIGHAEVRQTFKASGIGTIAGSYVLDGKIQRGCKARITREGVVIFDGQLASLKRFQDDVKEVATNYECGLVFEKFNDVQEGDLVELYIMAEVPR